MCFAFCQALSAGRTRLDEALFGKEEVEKRLEGEERGRREAEVQRLR